MTWFSRLYSWVADAAAGTNIDATRMDAEFNNVGTALNKCITNDGTNAAAANIPMGGFKLTGLANGSAATDSVAFGQVSGLLSEWRTESAAVAYVSATSFKVTGDVTARYAVGLRVKTTNTGGTVYSTVKSSSYSAPDTTVTVVNDSGSIDSGLSVLAYGMLDTTYRSSPVGSSAWFYKSANQSHTAGGGATQFLFDTTKFDLLSELASNKFIAKASGTYLVSGRLLFTQTGSGFGAPYAWLSVDGVAVQQVAYTTGISYSASVIHEKPFCTLIRLSAGQALTLDVLCAVSGTITGGENGTYLAIQRVL